MIKPLIAVVLALMGVTTTATAATPVTATQTNVLQNINLALTIYQQGATNPLGTKVADKVTSFTTKNLIAALAQVTGQSFGANPKLVLSTAYSNVTITTGSNTYSTVFSTNLALATNVSLSVGGVPSYYGANGNQGILIISNNTWIVGNVGNIATNVISVVGNPSESVTINTNAGFLTTITPTTNGTANSADVTNVTILMQQLVTAAPTESILTNTPSSVDILYGTGNTLYPLSNYVTFSANSPEIVIAAGVGLNTNNPSTFTNLASQTAYAISNLTINYFTTTGPTNLILNNLTAFVKHALKVDVLSPPSARGTNKVVEDIFGASATWNVIGSGYAGGGYIANITNPAAIAVGNYVDGNLVTGFLTNPTPVVVQGTVNITFLKNLPQ